MKILAGALALAALVPHSPPPAPPRAPAPAALTAVGYSRGESIPIHYRPLDLASLASQASAIVVADVRHQRCRWGRTQRLIWTDTALSVLECWKGHLEGTITLSEPGGELPPLVVHVTGTVRYEVGERVVVFLTRDSLGQLRTLGGIQGRFRVMGPRGSEMVDLASVPPAVVSDGFARGRQDGVCGEVPLRTFKATVAGLTAASEGR